MSDEGPKISTGRLGRLARLASMGARLSTDVVSRGVKRLRNADADDLSALGPAAAEKLVATLGELKGLAMKMGQQMSMDPDLLTPEVRAVISRLQNQAPPMPYAQVQQVIFEQLKAAPHEVFASFDEKPMASASLGQVHRAVTKAGLAVAVKIQYPDIAKALESDLNNMSSMVTVLGAATRVGHAKSYFNEFKDSLTDELDYRAEAQRADVFRTACTALPLLVVPQVEHSLTAEKVLTMELLSGPTLKEFLNNKTAATPNDELLRVSKLLIHAIWGTFLLSGVIHADPHPGNFILLADGRMGILDFGAIKKLSARFHDVAQFMFRQTADDQPLDCMKLSYDCGFEFEDPAAAKPIVEGVIDLALLSARSRDFDYGTSSMNRDMKLLFMKNATRMTGIRPPKESVQFYRALGGLSNNLANVGARGNFHGLYAELADMVPVRT